MPHSKSPPLFKPEAPVPEPSRRSYKVVLYSHDTFGLGNVRRALLLAEAIRDEIPDAAILIVTGSPVIQAFRIPESVDYIKLPCLDRVDRDRYEPRYLGACAQEVKRTRRAILRNAILGFDPDLLIVDKRPTGVDGELVETLELLRSEGRATRIVLGIRDILDAPEETRRSLERSGSFEAMERYYDEIWIYGTSSVFDSPSEYGFPAQVARKTVFCGYLRRPTVPSIPRRGAPRVLVTTGGSGDGGAVLDAYLEGLIDLPRRLRLESTVIFGPHLPPHRRAQLVERYGSLPDVQLVDFEPDMTRRYAEADVVVSMAGYNAVCEILSFGMPALLVPRARPVEEQLIRARLLERLGLVDLLEPSDLHPTRLLEKVLQLLAAPRSDVPSKLDLGGLHRVRDRVRKLLHNVERGSPAPVGGFDETAA